MEDKTNRYWNLLRLVARVRVEQKKYIKLTPAQRRSHTKTLYALENRLDDVLEQVWNEFPNERPDIPKEQSIISRSEYEWLAK